MSATLPPGDPALLCKTDGRGVAAIVFNRPAKSNAFDAGMRREFVALLDELAADPAVRLLVLKGGGKHFSAGSDVAAMGGETPEQRIELFLRLDAFPKPTLAVVHGACLGAALAMVACCDVVCAASDAFFSIPEVRLGIAPLGLAPLFVRAMGPSAFRRHAISGERFDAERALQLGLVHRVCGPQTLDADAQSLVDELLHGAPGAIAALKRAVATLSSPDLGPEMIRLAHEERQLMQSAEAQEGIQSFQARRAPSWRRD